jgi:hypothetical protein
MSPSLLRALGRGSERDSRREAAIRRYGRGGSPVSASGGGADHRGRRSRRTPKALVYVQRR